MNFAKNLKQSRKNLGISQGELAKRLDVVQSTITNYETGIRYPRLDKLEDIAKVVTNYSSRAD